LWTKVDYLAEKKFPSCLPAAMSDFYQILKREIKPNDSPASSSEKEDGLIVKKQLVDNSVGKTKKTKGKKRKNIPRAKKLRSKSSYAKAAADKPEDKSNSGFLSQDANNPVWLTMAEAAKLGGIQKRTIKRAIRANAIRYRIVESRYQVDMRSVLLYFFSKKKLWNKLIEFGIGQYVEKWKN
jgi:hypothetical protein